MLKSFILVHSLLLSFLPAEAGLGTYSSSPRSEKLPEGHYEIMANPNVSIEDLQLPKVTNIVSGVPLAGAADPSGGFGDVAANLYAAFELKKRYPNIEINFLITDLSSGKRSSDLVQLMVPDLNTQLKGIVQFISGINFIIVNQEAHFRNHGVHYLETSKTLGDSIPKSDLSLQLSGNNVPVRQILNTNSQVALNFTEFGGSTDLLSFKNSNSFGEPSYSSGPRSNGLYMIHPQMGDIANHETVINGWISNQNRRLIDFTSEHLVFSYSKHFESQEFYFQAISKIARRHPEEKFHLVGKQFNSRMSEVNFPSNVHIIDYKSLPRQVMEALISRASLSPLLTGDLSWSTGLSTTHPRKVAIYEALPWKRESAKAFIERLTPLVGEPEKLSSLYFDTRELSQMPRDIYDQKIEKLAQVLVDKAFLEKVSKTIKSLTNEWDLLEGVLRLHAFQSLFKTELKIKVLVGKILR